MLQITIRSFSLAAAVASLALTGTAQYVTLYSPAYQHSYGNGDAGAVVRAEAALSASLDSRLVTTGSGRYVAVHRQDTLVAHGRGSASADLKLLGQTRRAGEFRVALTAVGQIKRNASTGAFLSASCNQYGTVYARVGDTVLWDWRISPTFSAGLDYRIRIATPYLVFPVGAGVAAFQGNLYGRLRGSVTATINACSARVAVDGDMSASGNASASGTVISLLAFAEFTGRFTCDDQKLEFDNFRVEPAINPTLSWGRGGAINVRSGAMSAKLSVDAILPPFIPVSRTLASWSKAATVKRIL